MSALPPLVRICPQCDVRLDSARCQHCFSLQGPGDFACGRCGHALELEPLLDPTDAPCPRCRTPLEAASDDPSLSECARCGGIFVTREALVRILTAAEVNGPLRPLPGAASLGDVRYLACPQCHGTMNRVNFGRVSGVIVDVCRVHGTWFDAGELTRVVGFVGAGGLAKTREREQAMKREEHQKLATEHARLHGEMLALDHRGRSIPDHARADVIRRMLDALFRA